MSYTHIKPSFPEHSPLQRVAEERLSLIVRIGNLYSQRIEGVPRILIVHSVSYPLCHDLLFSLKDRASRVLRKTSVHNLGDGINVRKENGISHDGFDVDSRISKVG